MEFELKLASSKTAVWEGNDGIDAAKRYVDCKGGTVIAWRDYPRYGVFIGSQRILEPGDKDYERTIYDDNQSIRNKDTDDMIT